jgi:hypothetical protein
MRSLSHSLAKPLYHGYFPHQPDLFIKAKPDNAVKKNRKLFTNRLSDAEPLMPRALAIVID